MAIVVTQGFLETTELGNFTEVTLGASGAGYPNASVSGHYRVRRVWQDETIPTDADKWEENVYLRIKTTTSGGENISTGRFVVTMGGSLGDTTDLHTSTFTLGSTSPSETSGTKDNWLANIDAVSGTDTHYEDPDSGLLIPNSGGTILPYRRMNSNGNQFQLISGGRWFLVAHFSDTVRDAMSDQKFFTWEYRTS